MLYIIYAVELCAYAFGLWSFKANGNLQYAIAAMVALAMLTITTAMSAASRDKIRLADVIRIALFCIVFANIATTAIDRRNDAVHDAKRDVLRSREEGSDYGEIQLYTEIQLYKNGQNYGFAILARPRKNNDVASIAKIMKDSNVLSTHEVTRPDFLRYICNAVDYERCFWAAIAIGTVSTLIQLGIHWIADRRRAATSD